MPKQTVLIIEDEPELQEILTYNLEALGYQVHVYDHGWCQRGVDVECATRESCHSHGAKCDHHPPDWRCAKPDRDRRD